MPEHRNVTALPTQQNGDQGWQCKVCGQRFSYSQPIGFGLQLALLQAFMAAHVHDAPVLPAPPVESGSLAAMLAHAEQCAAAAPFLDAGRTEHTRLAADVQRLVHLVRKLRSEATGSVPQCINLAGIDRLIANALAQ